MTLSIRSILLFLVVILQYYKGSYSRETRRNLQGARAAWDPAETLRTHGASSNVRDTRETRGPVAVTTFDDVLDRQGVQRNTLPEVQCGTYPRVEKVYPDGNAPEIHSPMYVMLHRCGGACGQQIYDCIPIASDTFTISVTDIINNDITMATVTNHTKCACSCKTASLQTCGADQEWNAMKCRCECRGGPLTCKGAGQAWDPRKCKCTR